MNRTRGFTLIELAMVLFILALVLGGLMSPLSTRLEQAGREETKELLNQIKESLLGYALVHGHLPCPDCPDGSVGYCGAINTNDPADIADGQEDVVDNVSYSYAPRYAPPTVTTFATCAVEVGYLPFANLGVPGDDTWDRRIIYSVDQSFADDTDGTGCGAAATPGVSFEICSTGDMKILDKSLITTNPIAQGVPVLIYSLGKNGSEYGGTTPTSPMELENWWTDATDRNFASDSYMQTSGSEYDDLVVWISSPSLMYRMVSAERLP